MAWWALAAGRVDDATVFATDAARAAAGGDGPVRGAGLPQLADAAQAASPGGDPATQLVAETAVAAAKAIADPTAANITAFLALAQERAADPAYRSLTDAPDVAALAARLA